MRLTGFHVHAVGWILVFNASRFGREQAPVLSRLWNNLVQARARDLRMAHPLFRLLAPRALRLSNDSLAALAVLLAHVASAQPERFGLEALRRRRNYWVFQVLFGFSLTFLVVRLLPESSRLAQAVVPASFVMSIASIVPLITLWRTFAAMRWVTQGAYGVQDGEHPPYAQPLPTAPSSPPAHDDRSHTRNPAPHQRS